TRLHDVPSEDVQTAAPSGLVVCPTATNPGPPAVTARIALLSNAPPPEARVQTLPSEEVQATLLVPPPPLTSRPTATNARPAVVAPSMRAAAEPSIVLARDQVRPSCEIHAAAPLRSDPTATMRPPERVTALISTAP